MALASARLRAHAPAPRRPDRREPAGGREAAAHPADAIERAHLQARAAPADVGGVDGQLDVAQPQRPGVARRLAVAQALRAGGGRRVGRPAALAGAPASGGGAGAWSPVASPWRAWRRARVATRRAGSACGSGRRSRRGGRPRGARRGDGATNVASTPSPVVEVTLVDRHGVNRSPGSAGASRADSQRSTEAPTSASGPSWRRPPWPSKRASSGRVLARVVGARRGRVAAVVGREDEQVARGVEAVEPAADRGVDHPQRGVEARHVAAVAVDLVGLDEVGEHEAAVELVDQRPRPRRSPPRSWRRGARDRRRRPRRPA